jgi:hypothetical protein
MNHLDYLIKEAMEPGNVVRAATDSASRFAGGSSTRQRKALRRVFGNLMKLNPAFMQPLEAPPSHEIVEKFIPAAFKAYPQKAFARMLSRAGLRQSPNV